jgi:hypothetical protein
MDEYGREVLEPSFEVVWPLGRVATEAVDLAPALSDLNGKTVCELWDWLFRGDQMYPVINEELRARYPDIKIVDHEAMGNTHGTHGRAYVANLAELLRKHGCDAVISAVGA